MYFQQLAKLNDERDQSQTKRAFSTDCTVWFCHEHKCVFLKPAYNFPQSTQKFEFEHKYSRFNGNMGI